MFHKWTRIFRGRIKAVILSLRISGTRIYIFFISVLKKTNRMYLINSKLGFFMTLRILISRWKCRKRMRWCFEGHKRHEEEDEWFKEDNVFCIISRFEIQTWVFLLKTRKNGMNKICDSINLSRNANNLFCLTECISLRCSLF